MSAVVEEGFITLDRGEASDRARPRARGASGVYRDRSDDER
jgi:hypothetical protein